MIGDVNLPLHHLNGIKRYTRRTDFSRRFIFCSMYGECAEPMDHRGPHSRKNWERVHATDMHPEKAFAMLHLPDGTLRLSR